MSKFVNIENDGKDRGIFYYEAANYDIIVKTNKGNESQITHSFGVNTEWESKSGYPFVHIHFHQLVLINEYSVFRARGSSFATSYVLLGKKNGKYRTLDAKENQTFGTDTEYARTNLTLTYPTTNSFLTKDVVVSST